MASKLFRPHENRIIGGVCAGLAQYFNIDVVIIRLIFILISLSGGAGIIAYIILLVVMPEESGKSYADIIKNNIESKDNHETKGTVKKVAKDFSNIVGKNDNNAKLFAAILIMLGLVFLMRNFLPNFFSFSRIWPLLVIGIGLVILLSGKRRG